MIANACEPQLKLTKKVQSNDSEGIKRYAETLKKMLITLEDIRFYGSLNSLDTISQLVNKLPYEGRKQWVRESVKLEKETGKVPDFSSVAKFVNRLSDEANSLKGRRVLSAQISTSTSKIQTTFGGKKSGNSYNVIVSKPSFYCKESNHGLLKCKKFKDAPLAKRSKFIKRNKMYYQCLSSIHRT